LEKYKQQKKYISLDVTGLGHYVDKMGYAISTCISYTNFDCEKIAKKIRNPFIWFQEGIQFIVLFPINFFFWSGIIEYSIVYKIVNNTFFKIILSLFSFVGFVVGLIGSIVTIVLGYDEMEIILNNVIENILK
jgi:hypothetical protein